MNVAQITPDGNLLLLLFRGEKSAIENRAHGEEEAQHLIAEGLKAAELGAGELEKRPKSDPVKAALAELVWSRFRRRVAVT